MKLIQIIAIAVIITGMHAGGHAGVKCDDWINRGGYCIDYVKTRIPTFPLPQTATELAALKNKDIPDVAEGDVAVFRYRHYWHVAYIEKVHRNKQGEAKAIDVSEMNFGRKLSFYDYQAIWSIKSDSEWKRAVACGVTHNYSKKTSRKNVELATVKQIWSPAAVTAKDERKRRVRVVLDKVRGVFSRFFLSLQSKENS